MAVPPHIRSVAIGLNVGWKCRYPYCTVSQFVSWVKLASYTLTLNTFCVETQHKNAIKGFCKNTEVHRIEGRGVG